MKYALAMLMLVGGCVREHSAADLRTLAGKDFQVWRSGMPRQIVRLEAEGDGVVFATYDGRRVELAEVDRAEHVNARRGHWQGAGIGALAGAGVGVIGGFVEGDDEPCNEAMWFCSEVTAGEKAVVYGGLGAITGAIIGYLLGDSIGARDVYVGGQPMRVEPAPTGVAVRF